MAELYASPKQYLTAGGQSGNASNAQPSIESIIESLPADEREEAMKYITAPPSGEEIARAMAEKNSRGELMNMSLDQYRLFKAHQKAKETDVIGTIGEAASTVFDEIFKAAGSVYDKPVDSMAKLTPSVVEAFAQGTRNLYGMAAQSVDPNSVFFRMKNALQANGDDEEAEYQQFMEAQAFNLHSMRLMTGQDTIIMDKDVINPEMTQVMSYIADPTLFIPFGGIAAKGATMVGMGEKLAMASARTAALKRMVLGGTLKWGVGAPIEFLGTAVRNTIDYGLERGSKAFETVTGMPAAEVRATAQMTGLHTASAALSGANVPLPVVGNVAGALVGSTTARGVGEAISTFGEQMMKQKNTGRGVLGYAGQALRDTQKKGIVLSEHAKKLLGIIEAVDPFFVYADEITEGAFQGAVIGGGLGYLAGGEEGMAGGIGSGMALGAVGAGAGKLTSDISGNTKMEQMAIQRKLVVEGLKEAGNENAIAFEAMAMAAEATGDRVFQAQIDGIIAGIDVVNPDVIIKAFNEKGYTEALKSQGIDPTTGKLREKSRIFPELGDRRTIADVLGILRDNGGNFAGDPAGFEKAIKTEARYKKLKPIWERLDDNAKSVLLKQIKENANPDFIKSLKGRQVNAHFGDLAYAERLAEMINTLNEKNANLVPSKIAETLKAETRSDKKLTRRGQMLKEKLQADGYIDKDGTIRKSRNLDVEETLQSFDASAGWTKRRNSTGQTEIVINLDKFMAKGNRESMPHELFHSIMRDSVFAKDYADRLIQKLVGTFDPQTGKLIEKAVVDPDQLKKFMQGYINSVHRNQSEEFRNRKIKELDVAMEEFKKRTDQNRIADGTQTQLESLVEEFGAYYFAKFVMDKPVDFLFRGGEFSGIRGIFEASKESFLDFWRSKIAKNNPSLNFDNIEGYALSRGFGKDGKRAKVTALDLLMQDMIRMQSNLNKGGRFDISNLSPDARKQFIQTHGLRGQGFETIDKAGNLKKPKLRRYTAEEIRQGKEMFKVLDSLSDADHRGGMRRDGDGNWSGRPNTAQMNALIGTGYLQRAWFDRLNFAYNIIDGKGSNVVEFGYLGYSAHIGDGNERVYGAAVPFKNRRAILLDVDFKVRADGTTFANFHTLDLRVIEARGNEVWRDPQVRDLWNGDRTSMEADFYAYLSNASLPSNDPNRKPSFRLLDRGDGLGGQRRDALHQMLGFHKGSDLPYINKPIAEIPVGIRHSVTTFSNDGIVSFRTSGNERVDYNHANAHLDLTRNFMPSEMTEEKTPSGGKVIKHATGYNISKQAGEKFKVFSPEGELLGQFDTVADAGRAAQKHFNDTFDKSVEGKDPAVPPTEIPPPRQAYVEKNVANEVWMSIDDTKKADLISELDGWLSYQGKWEQNGVNYSVGDRNLINNTKIVESIKRALEEDSINPPENFIHGLEIAVGRDRQRLYEKVLNNARNELGAKYDAMYPMEIKSALYGTLAQIFQDYPQITAKALIGKIQKYGSLNKARLMQEATEIGLIDLLKSKPMATKIKKDIYRAYDIATESFTGEVKTKETPVQYEPYVDIQEILDFAKSKEIKVTIEENAREVNGLDTERLTLGGTKYNYKQTAIRINPEYAHGIRGHYGEDTIVHFRTTERLDSEGNKVLFIEEVQANNTDDNKAVSEVAMRRMRTDLETLEQYKKDAVDAGIFVEGESDTGNKTYVNEKENWFKEYGYSEAYSIVREAVRKEIVGSGYDMALDRDGVTSSIMDEIETSISRPHLKDGISFVENIEDNLSYNDKHFKIFERVKETDGWKQFVESAGRRIERDYNFFQDKGTKLLSRDLHEAPYNAMSILDHQRVREHISDLNTAIAQSITKGKTHPMTDVKDWSLTALKGIIRQAIRDGLDTITLTHPDDSPTVSHMVSKSRSSLYGKIIPELWSSWLSKYGIEIKQNNKLSNATIETHRKNLVEIQNKIPEANQLIMDRFEQVMSGENQDTIRKASEILSMPVHELLNESGTIDTFSPKQINDFEIRELFNINDRELRNKIKDVLELKKAEFSAYKTIEKVRAEGQRGLSLASTDVIQTHIPDISAEAIDRGMTFVLNDRIKRDFLDGKIQTHMMPAEGGAEGGRTYTPEQFKTKFIGRIAAENPELTKNLSIKVLGDKNSFEFYIYDKNSSDTTPIGEISTINKSSNSKDNIITKAYLKPEYRGKGFGKLLYSELGERLRSVGIENIEGTVTDLQNRPFSIRASVFGKDSTSRMAGTQDGVTTRLDPSAHYQPSEEDIYRGGRTYNQNSKQWKAGFLGLYAEQNPDRIKGLNLQFMQRADGSHRIRLTDNSKKGESADVGHITANISGDTATLSSHINEAYRGKKLAYVVYSEMAERLRAMGITAVDGTIVNPDGVPVKVREKIIGDTRDMYSGRRINYVEAANRIQDKQALVGSAGGVDVTNTLYKQARYMPAESFTPSEEVTKKAKAAGYTILGQHKTNNQFNEFDLKAKKVNRGLNPAGHYFTTTENDYKGSRTINAFLKLENPWNGVATKADKQAFKQWFRDKYSSQYEGASDTHIAYLDGKMNQFVKDGIFPTLIDGDAQTEFLKSRGYDGWKDGSDVVVFDSSQIKSAEDFTYDDQGNKIPLSERFDKSKKDIRYMPAELEVLNIQRTQDMPWFKNLIAGGSYVRYAGVDELNYLRGLHAISHGADTLTGVDVNTTEGRRVVEGKGGLGYALNPNNPAAWASIGKGFINEINGAVRRNIDEAIAGGMSRAEAEEKAKTAIMPLVFTTYRKNLNSVQGSEGYYNIFEIIRRGNIISDTDLRLAMTKAVEKVSLNPKTKEYEKNQTETLRKIVKNTKSSWDEMLAGIFATLTDSDVQNFGTRSSMADDFFGAVWSRLELSKAKEDKIKSIFPEWKTVSSGKKITVEDMKANVADITTDTLSKGLKSGDIYAILKFNDFVTNTDSNHRSYNTGVIQENGQKPEILILKKPIQYSDFYASSVTSKGENPLSELGKSQQTNLLGMNARPYGTAKVKLAGEVDFRDVAAKMMPAEGWRDWKSERTSVGSLFKNAVGYVIMVQGDKFKVYNPYKAMVGIYSDLEQAKRRVQRDEPKR